MSEEQKTQSDDSIIDILKEAAGDLLTEDTLSSIETAFNEAVDTKVDSVVEDRISLHVEKALTEMDEEHAVKLESLLEAIDTDHTAKLHKVLEAVNENHAIKLRKVAKRYHRALVSEAKGFKGQIVDNISNYLDMYLENAIPADDLAEAVKNKKALEKIDEVRKFLGVDLAVGKDAIRDAIVDGKRQIEESRVESNQLVEENTKLQSELIDLKRTTLLESKTKGLPTVKRKYITKVLGDKDLDFIEENFDYTLSMFERTEEERLDAAKKQATRQKVNVDRPRTQTLNESAQEQPTGKADPMGYMSELSKF